jgi:hypothetical protein
MTDDLGALMRVVYPDAERRTVADPPQNWYFTFGGGHTYNGWTLAFRYVLIHGTHDAARARMVEAFGDRWAMQYASAEEAGVEEFGLTELKLAAESGNQVQW